MYNKFNQTWSSLDPRLHLTSVLITPASASLKKYQAKVGPELCGRSQLNFALANTKIIYSLGSQLNIDGKTMFEVTSIDECECFY